MADYEKQNNPNIESVLLLVSLTKSNCSNFDYYRSMEKRGNGKLSVENLESAERMWIHEIQSTYFNSELISIRKDEP